MRRSVRGRRGVRLLLDQLVEFGQRGLRHFVQRGDAHQHFGAHVFGEQRQDAGRLFGFEMRQDDGGDLRMFAADDLRDRLRFHPFQRLDALARLTRRHPVEQHVGLLFADRLRQHPPHEVLRSAGDVRLRVGHADELVEHGGHLLARDLLELGHRDAQFLHFAGVQLLEHIGGVLLAQAHQQDGGALRAGEFVGLVSHPRRPIP